MPWTCSRCGDEIVSRSKFILHTGLCKKHVFNLKNSECLPTEVNINKQCGQVNGTDDPLDNNTRPTNNSSKNCEKPIVQTCATVVNTINDCAIDRPNTNFKESGQGNSVLAVIDEDLPDISNSFIEEHINGDNAINFSNDNNATDQELSLKGNPTVIPGFDELIADTLCDIHQVSQNFTDVGLTIKQ